MEWRGEMQVLRSDIGAIRSSNGSNFQICIAGDFNVQPASLGGGVDCRPARVAAVEEFESELGFSLLNPHFAGESRRPVWLRHRKQWASIRHADTRCGPESPSRAIDLAFCSHATDANMIIHNSLHC